MIILKCIYDPTFTCVQYDQNWLNCKIFLVNGDLHRCSGPAYIPLFGDFERQYWTRGRPVEFLKIEDISIPMNYSDPERIGASCFIQKL